VGDRLVSRAYFVADDAASGRMTMTSNIRELSGDKKPGRTWHMGQTIARRLHALRLFWIKFNNDWSWNNAAGLAYNLLVYPVVTYACTHHASWKQRVTFSVVTAMVF